MAKLDPDMASLDPHVAPPDSYMAKLDPHMAKLDSHMAHMLTLYVAGDRWPPGGSCCKLSGYLVALDHAPLSILSKIARGGIHTYMCSFSCPEHL